LTLQRRAGNAVVVRMLRSEGGSRMERILDVVQSGSGRPLGAGIRDRNEAHLGEDLSAVRVHTGPTAGASATSIEASAYTLGDHIVLGRGLDPSSRATEQVLAHELAHVVQQRAGPVDGTLAPDGLRLSDPSDRFERAAEATAREAMSGAPGNTTSPEAATPGATHASSARAVSRLTPEPTVQRQFDVASQTRDWSNLTNVKRSAGGKTSGVTFATNNAGQRLVVKFLHEGAGPTFADQLISQALGIATPNSRVLSGAEAKTAKKAIKARKADLTTKEQRKELDKHVRAPYVQIQEFAVATPFDELDSTQRLAVLNDATAVRTVGKLAVADTFMDNWDRVTRTQCNLGNLMLRGDGTVIAIDNEASFDPALHEKVAKEIDVCRRHFAVHDAGQHGGGGEPGARRHAGQEVATEDAVARDAISAGPDPH
jgi:hypothetical protein